jgi:prepilin-type N-terminal cleavage/methylation domain-containing protein
MRKEVLIVSPAKNPRRKRGFTLLELVCVIAIIGILSGLAAHVIHKGKQKASLTRCLNNLKQIGYGIQLYVDDYRAYPSDMATNSAGLLIRFHGTIGGPNGRLAGSPGYEILPLAKERPLFHYVHPGEVFHCSEDSGTRFDSNATPPGSCFQNWGCSYLYNVHVGNRQMRNIESISPSLLILMYEPPATAIGGKDGETRYYQWHYRRGKGSIDRGALKSSNPRFVSPILFRDGHTAQHDFTKSLLYGANPMSPTPDWVWTN